ncbi:MAG: hypothetical protein IKK05_07100 [Alistipes sp.]|nr:hypothetical protein [Alistipes sp.]
MKKLFSIFTILAIAFGFTACDMPKNETDDTTTTITLSKDKDTIAADGVDFVTFTTLVNGEANADVQIVYLKDNTILTENKFFTTVAGEHKFKAIYGKHSSEEVTITATATTSVVLTADKETILADGADTVTFTVTVDGVDKTSESVITVLNYKAPLEGNTFTETVAGEFIFKAKYQEFVSNEVKVTVEALPVPKELKIKVSPNRIKADGIEEAMFTVTYGEDDVTADAEIYNTKSNEIIESKKFSSTVVGSYTFRARYDGQTTGVSATVEVYDPELAGKYELGSIYEANGSKGVIYAIKADNKGVTWCYLFSLDEEDLQWSTVNEWCNCINDKGAWNTSDPFNYYGQDINNYPAFKWCVEHGEGWFLPSSTELNWMWEAITNGERDFDAPSVAEWNKIITDNGGEPFCEDYYWSSNETSDDLVEVIAFMDDSVVCLDPKKDNKYTARAAYRFKVE